VFELSKVNSEQGVIFLPFDLEFKNVGTTSSTVSNGKCNRTHQVRNWGFTDDSILLGRLAGVQPRLSQFKQVAVMIAW